MRTFASSGKMLRPFYNLEDPFAENRPLDDLAYSIDFFYTRLLKTEEKVNTKTAKKVAKRRSIFLKSFLKELKEELNGQ